MVGGEFESCLRAGPTFGHLLIRQEVGRVGSALRKGSTI
jgi:hypothetical protein